MNKDASILWEQSDAHFRVQVPQARCVDVTVPTACSSLAPELVTFELCDAHMGDFIRLLKKARKVIRKLERDGFALRAMGLRDGPLEPEEEVVPDWIPEPFRS